VPIVHANGIDLSYEVHGQGEPLLLMAPTGWPGSVWDLEQVPFFARSFRVITYDQRGVGRSSQPDEEYTTAQLGDDALALLHALDAVPAHVLGFSMGGRSAQLMALREPGAFRSLILAASHPGSPGARQGVPLGMALALAEHGYGLEFWIDHLLEELPFSPEFRQRSPEKVRRLAETITERQPPLKLYLRHVLARGSHDVVDRLPEIRVPTLVIVGAHDVLTPPDESRAIAEGIRGARLVTIDQAGHMSNLENPEAFNAALLEFLGQL
jgi:pimeloyl-ACP methyl ester carboxylesterase